MKTPEENKKQQDFEFEVDKTMFTESLELMIDLNDEDCDDTEGEMLASMKKDDTAMKSLLHVMQQQDASILSWLLNTLVEDYEYRRKRATEEVLKLQA